jgi:hypothetical protein
MVKIRELSNQQIVQQLTKYFKFITALDSERQKRISQGADQDELYTSEELEARSIADVSRVKPSGEVIPAESTTIFHLKIDDKQLDQLAESANAEPRVEQVSVSDLISQSAKGKTESQFQEFDSDVTSHKLNLVPKKGKKKIIKKK